VGQLNALLRRLVVLQPGEAPALLASFATLLCTFSSYAILRPVRDALGVTSGLETLPYLFWAVFIAMLLLQPLYGWLTSRLPRSVFLPWVYIFFAANLVGFWLWFHVETNHTWIARSYFVWVSVFNLFILAAFWGLMADVFTREQAGRLFGFIWAGASSGGVIGPYIDKKLAVPLGAINLLLLSAALLLIALVFMRLVIRWQHHQGTQVARAAAATADGGSVAHGVRGVGGGVLAAFSQVARSPYLLGIGGFVLLMTWVNTFFYLEQQAFVAKAFTSASQRTHFFASIDLYVQIASLAMQFLLFGRLYRWFGMRALLAFVPLMMTAGYALYALAPAFMLLVIVYAVRRLAVHGGVPRGEVPGEEPARHFRLSGRRCDQRLAPQAARRGARRRSFRRGLGRRADLGGLDGAGARPRLRLRAAGGRGARRRPQAALDCASPLGPSPSAAGSPPSCAPSAVAAVTISAASAKRSPRDLASSRASSGR
jgi:ATP:ADP antiporter, AAA family